MKTFHRTILVCTALALAAPAWARQAVSGAQPDDPAKGQVQIFEIILKTAVETGSRNFAQRAAKVVPEVSLQPSDVPIVNGVAHREAGRTSYVFHVQVPFIWPEIQVMNMWLNRGQGRPVGNGDRVQAGGGVVAPDPMDPPVNVANRPDLEREYATSVRTALVDALLDNSGGLPVSASDTVFIFASGSEAAGSNPLARTVPRKLMLSLKGADFMDFRQGKITRDELKLRIAVSSF